MEGNSSSVNEKSIEETIKALYDTAVKASENAYAPYSDFKVGAALLASSGRIYTGVNVENSSFGATICAERTAFVKALSEGERSFVMIAVAAPFAEKPTESLPCGICRQFMYEFAPDIYIVTGTDRDHLNERTLNELLPLGFRLDSGR